MVKLSELATEVFCPFKVGQAVRFNLRKLMDPKSDLEPEEIEKYSDSDNFWRPSKGKIARVIFCEPLKPGVHNNPWISSSSPTFLIHVRYQSTPTKKQVTQMWPEELIAI